jgi:transcriptional regulator with XRE-family HTH domain
LWLFSVTKPVFSAAQLRAARALLGWSQDKLAEESLVSRAAIAAIELETREPQGRTLIDLLLALARAGVMPFDEDDRGGPGVRFVPPVKDSIDPQVAARIRANRAKLFGDGD